MHELQQVTIQKIKSLMDSREFRITPKFSIHQASTGFKSKVSGYDIFFIGYGGYSLRIKYCTATHERYVSIRKKSNISGFSEEPIRFDMDTIKANGLSCLELFPVHCSNWKEKREAHLSPANIDRYNDRKAAAAKKVVIETKAGVYVPKRLKPSYQRAIRKQNGGSVKVNKSA